MTLKTSWPWISLLIGGAVAVSPIGQDVIHSSFFSGEQLSRTLNQFLLQVALGIAATVALIEFGIRKLLISRQSRQANGAHHG